MTRSRRAALAATLIAAVVLALVVRKQLWRAGNSDVPEASAAELGTGTDSIALAKAALASCSKISGDKIPCYEKHLIPLVDRGGPKLAMGTLMQVANGDVEVRGFGHVYAHAIGMHAYDADKNVERTFSSCTDAFQSGCYHGVIEAYFASTGKVDSQSVRDLCVPWSQPGVYGWLRFQCAHGLGHGLTMHYEHNLVSSLKGCDLLVEDWDRQSCYGGAFMENVVDATEPHHGMPGMDMPEEKRAWKQIDKNDYNYPCTILPERYLTTCYQNQVSIIMYFDDHKMPQVAKDCMNVPENYRYMCFTGFGTDINSFVVGDHLKGIAQCDYAPEKYRDYCLIGVVKNIIDVSAKTADGVSFCQKVSDHHLKSRCYEAVGEESVSLEQKPEIRETYCAVSEPGYIEACRFGARLTTVAPPGLKAD
ncbi:MAG TPA: hypothetical protein VK511_07790 [Gemmatimonadaceae bacterium]|nr:hypothetical protein [Gemmatimonadaceae bacterium]